LQANRDRVIDFVQGELPGITVSPLEGTYLAWQDCRSAGIENPYEFFLQQARVALNDGATFGIGGDGFVRLNFDCPRAVLIEALERMKAAYMRQLAPTCSLPVGGHAVPCLIQRGQQWPG
jgi:cystathionine beta-lyase